MMERKLTTKAVVVLLLIVQVALPASSSCGPSSWDFLRLSQSWPPGVQVTMGSKFVITPDVTSWVIHGLWPTCFGTDKPNNCNTTASFDLSKLASLMNELHVRWPSLSSEETAAEFWEHEWMKHGTCATTLPATMNEYLYFKTTLQLADKYSLQRMLAAENIVPTEEKMYLVDRVSTAIQNQVKSVPIVLCSYSKSTKKQYLLNISICVDKTFNVIDCPQPPANNTETYFSCDKGDNLFYPPIVYPVSWP